MMLMQVDPTETDKWTKVDFASDSFPIPASLVVIYIYADSVYDAVVRDVTADACIPSLRKYRRHVFCFSS